MMAPFVTRSRGLTALRQGVLAYVLALVALPLAAVVASGLGQGLSGFWVAVTSPLALEALRLTVWTSAMVALMNGVLGTATAYVLVRYRFPGRSLLTAAVDLPLAVPTLVAGVMLAVLYGPSSLLGAAFEARGISIIYARPGIVLALLFVSSPFVIRAVEPVLLELDPAEEEAAVTLGSGPMRTFRTVVWPSILPAVLSGSIRSLARSVGEFGSIVVVAGNVPFETLTAPVHVFGQIESGAPHAGAAVSVVLLVLAVGLHLTARLVDGGMGGGGGAA